MADKKGGGGGTKRTVSYEVDLIDCLPKGVASYLGKDLSEESREFIKSKKIKLKPLKLEVEGAFDDFKDDKTIAVDSYFCYRGFFVGFDKAVKKAQKDDKPDQIEKAYGGIEGNCNKALKKWAEKEASGGKGSDEEALEKGNEAMEALNGLDLKGVFQNPCESALNALKPLTKGTPDAAAAKKANGALNEAQLDFGNFGKKAEEAIGTLLENAKKIKDDKKASADVQKFGKDVLKFEARLQPIVDGAKELTKTLDTAIKDTEADKVDARAMAEHYKKFQKLAALEKSAQDAIALAKKMAPQLKKLTTANKKKSK